MALEKSLALVAGLLLPPAGAFGCPREPSAEQRHTQRSGCPAGLPSVPEANAEFLRGVVFPVTQLRTLLIPNTGQWAGVGI